MTDLTTLTAEIVAVYAENNELAEDDLPLLIRAVGRALADAANPSPPATERPQKPAVPIRQSVFPDYIVSLEDGQKLKMLRRYLLTRFGLTPAAYRAKWGLPHDYPMVAPNYSEHRSALAHKRGLGKVSGRGGRK